MKFYSFNLPNALQTWSKYFLDYDNTLNGLTVQIELQNPNYLILNLEYESLPFYSEAELRELGIISIEKSANVDIVIVKAYKLKGHQGIVNHYGTNVKIRFKEAIGSEAAIEREFKQGFVIISNALTEEEKTDPNFYLYHALGASGTYYVPSSWSPQSIWTYTTNATDKYGVVNFLTIANNGTRWLYQGRNSSMFMRDITNTPSHIIDINSLSRAAIASRRGSIWTTNYILGHEIYLQSGDNYEEVLAVERSQQQVLVNENGEATYVSTIDTNLESGYNLPLYINYY